MSSKISRRALFDGILKPEMLEEGLSTIDLPERRNFILAMFLALVAIIFPLPLMEEYLGGLRGVDLTTFDAMLKEYYTDSRVQELAYSTSPFFTGVEVAPIPYV